MTAATRRAPQASLRVTLPGGVWQDSDAAQSVREVALRAVGGEDEAFLLDTVDAGLPGERGTALLARCLDQPDGEHVARSLTVGDREALLLHLRRLTLGEVVDGVLRCPAEGCGEEMELDLRVSDLLVPPYPDVRRRYELSVEADGEHHDITFRLPTAADLESAALFARSDPEQGALDLLRHSVLRASRNGKPQKADELPAAVRSAIAAAMVERDAQAELELDLTCPACRTSFSVVFDTGTFFLQELDQRASRLLRDVHTLAWHYHWSERAILRMPARRRAQYLELVADATARSSPSARAQ